MKLLKTSLVFVIGSNRQVSDVYVDDKVRSKVRPGRPVAFKTASYLLEITRSSLRGDHVHLPPHWKKLFSKHNLLSEHGIKTDRVVVVKNGAVLREPLQDLVDTMTTAATFPKEERPRSDSYRVLAFEMTRVQNTIKLAHFPLPQDAPRDLRIAFTMEVVRLLRKERRINKARALLFSVSEDASPKGSPFHLRFLLEKYWLEFLHGSVPDELATTCLGMARGCQENGFLLAAADFSNLCALCVSRVHGQAHKSIIMAFDESIRAAVMSGQVDRINGALFNRAHYICEKDPSPSN